MAKEPSGQLNVEMLQKRNAYSEILVLIPVTVTLLRLAQLENASTPRVLTQHGMAMLVRLLQPSNAQSSISVTVYGMVTLFRLWELEKE